MRVKIQLRMPGGSSIGKEYEEDGRIGKSGLSRRVKKGV
jgi:hypothetical protein